MKQPCVQRGPFAGESAIRIVFNKKETPRQLSQMEEFLSKAIHGGELTITSRSWLSHERLRAWSCCVLCCSNF